MVEKEETKKRARSSSSSSSSSSGSSSSGYALQFSYNSLIIDISEVVHQDLAPPAHRPVAVLVLAHHVVVIPAHQLVEDALVLQSVVVHRQEEHADRDRPMRPSPSPPRRRRPSPSPPRRDRRDRSGSRQRRRASPRRSPAARSASPAKRVVIKNLSRNVLKTHLEEIFSIYGAIKNVDLPPDRFHNHVHRGYGYVEYDNLEDAEKSIKHMDGGQIDGMAVHVEMTIGRQSVPFQRRSSPFRRRSPPPRDRMSPMRRGGRSPPPHRRRSPMGGRGSGANNMPLGGPNRFRRASRSRSPAGRRSRS
nr:hypothetical protein K02F3.11 - Caenorhabditis elegans [Caenorhabditis elegans]